MVQNQWKYGDKWVLARTRVKKTYRGLDPSCASMLSCFALFTGHDLPSYHGLWNFGVLILVKTTINFGGKSWTYCIKNHIYLGAAPSLTNSTHHDLNTQSLTSVTLSCACTIKISKENGEREAESPALSWWSHPDGWPSSSCATS